MTGLTARNFGLADRGEIRAGAFADLVLFDPQTVSDRADYRQSALPSAGIVSVFCNGEAVWEREAPTGARPGRILAGHRR